MNIFGKLKLLPLHKQKKMEEIVDATIIAQAAIEQIAVISSDQIFNEYGVSRIF